MRDPKSILLCSVFLALLFVLVSSSQVYSITGKLLGKMSNKPWPVGMDLKNPGFWVHVVVFGLLVALAMVFCKP